MGEVIQFDPSKRKDKADKKKEATWIKPAGILTPEQLAERRKQNNQKTLQVYGIE